MQSAIPVVAGRSFPGMGLRFGESDLGVEGRRSFLGIVVPMHVRNVFQSKDVRSFLSMGLRSGDSKLLVEVAFRSFLDMARGGRFWTIDFRSFLGMASGALPLG